MKILTIIWELLRLTVKNKDQRLSKATCICKNKLRSPWRIKLPMPSMVVQFNSPSLIYRQETEHNKLTIALLIHRIWSESGYNAHCSFWGEWFAKTTTRRRHNFARSSLSDVKANFVLYLWLTMFWLLLKRLHFLLQYASNKMSWCIGKRNLLRVSFFLRNQTLFKISLKQKAGHWFSFVCLPACSCICLFNNHLCKTNTVVVVHIHMFEEDNETIKNILRQV